ncbi:MAG: GTP pyrophosphokinase [Bacteroidota bacterium]|jgi:(p)ppGpp synthase/HD superfamily hydrolase
MKQEQLLEHAIYIALQAHKGKADKGGSSYILHPLRVMLAMETTEEKIVAVLHDVVEDSRFTIQQLKQEGFSKKILDAVSLLTKTENQNYENYISAIRKNPLATKVKLADLKDNMDKSRLKKITEGDLTRIKKYKAALKQLIQ